MRTITYQRATPPEAPILTELRIRFAIELSGPQPQERIDKLSDQMVAYFSKATEDNSCISIIAWSDGKPVGIGTVASREQPGNFKNMSGKWGYIMNMYTVPEFRKMGICGKILDLLTTECDAIGITAFELHATDDGKLVYLKGGFHIHDEPTLRKFI